MNDNRVILGLGLNLLVIGILELFIEETTMALMTFVSMLIILSLIMKGGKKHGNKRMGAKQNRKRLR